MNDETRIIEPYVIEVLVDDPQYEWVSRCWSYSIACLQSFIEQRLEICPNCNQHFILLNEIRALFGHTINEDEWDIGKVWDNEEPADIKDVVVAVDNDNPIGVLVYVENMSKLDKSYREMSFLINKEDKKDE